MKNALSYQDTLILMKKIIFLIPTIFFLIGGFNMLHSVAMETLAFTIEELNKPQSYKLYNNLANLFEKTGFSGKKTLESARWVKEFFSPIPLTIEDVNDENNDFSHLRIDEVYDYKNLTEDEIEKLKSSDREKYLVSHLGYKWLEGFMVDLTKSALPSKKSAGYSSILDGNEILEFASKVLMIDSLERQIESILKPQTSEVETGEEFSIVGLTKKETSPA